ncbi:MAG TPA: hypothetical protein VFA68_03895 [Terriglobales bacterium]|nr:hypothetical protein [Terriglobales bacterium]
MKDPYAVLLQKEREMERVRNEVQALRSIVPLLAEEESKENVQPSDSSLGDRNRWPLQMK